MYDYMIEIYLSEYLLHGLASPVSRILSFRATMASRTLVGVQTRTQSAFRDTSFHKHSKLESKFNFELCKMKKIDGSRSKGPRGPVASPASKNLGVLERSGEWTGYREDKYHELLDSLFDLHGKVRGLQDVSAADCRTGAVCFPRDTLK